MPLWRSRALLYLSFRQEFLCGLKSAWARQSAAVGGRARKVTAAEWPPWDFNPAMPTERHAQWRNTFLCGKICTGYRVGHNLSYTTCTSPWPHRSINTCENLLRDNFPSGIEEKFHLSNALGLLHCFLAGCKTSVLHAPPDCETRSKGGKLQNCTHVVFE